LRTDPAFKLACGRLPDTGVDLCSQPTLSRLENAPFAHAAGPVWRYADQFQITTASFKLNGRFWFS
jgi:hypothetical protein